MLQAITLALGTALANAPPPLATAATDAPTVDWNAPSWMVLTVHSGADAAARGWEDVWRARWAPDFKNDPAGLDAWAADPEHLRYSHLFSEMVIDPSLPAGGTWTFFADKQARKPHSAFRLRHAESAPYRVLVDVYCGEPAVCAPLRERVSRMLAPAPRQRSLHGEWLRIVETEPCEPGSVHMPPPRYDIMGNANVRSGRLELVVRTNRCGDVRQAWPRAPSGDDDFDFDAARKALEWRIPAPADGAKTAIFVVPLTYGPSE